MTGTLYLVGTPIGNLGDITDRARRTLAAVDLVAAEDTRRTGRLLKELGISGRMVSFFQGNEASRVPELVRSLQRGSDVAVVSDAGMPGLSDPGHRLVSSCIEAGIPLDVVPGPSAAVAALVVSGFAIDRFVFEGFLPRSGRQRSAHLATLAREPRTAVMFESPRRTARTLHDLLAVCGDRRVMVARELTKLHQEFLRGSLSRVADDLEHREVRGEVLIVLEGAAEQAPGRAALDDAIRAAAELVAKGARKREAAKRAAERSRVPANEIYAGLAGR